MASDSKISGLPPISALSGSELIAFVQGGDTKQGSANDILTLLDSGFLTQGLNTLTEDLLFSGAYQLAIGTATKFADTFFSIKSDGNTDAGYAELVKNSSGTSLSYIRNDGLCFSKSTLTEFASISPSAANASLVMNRPTDSFLCSVDFITGSDFNTGWSAQLYVDGNYRMYDRVSGVSRFEITPTGNIEVIKNGGGLIQKSPDGTRWMITIDNTGTLSAVAA